MTILGALALIAAGVLLHPASNFRVPTLQNLSLDVLPSSSE